MDSIVDEENPSATAEQNDDESTIPAAQLNPLTLMTSVPPFIPVDDNQLNALESIDINRRQSLSSDIPLSFNADVSMPSGLVSSSDVTDQQTSSNVHIDNYSIAAWVESTTTESGSSTLERSPSLPSTLIESTDIRSRRDSNVSTLCDQHQLSIVSDTTSSLQPAFSHDMQRSLSMPFNDQYRHDDDDEENDRKLIQPENGEDGDDISTAFLAITESEESEVDKKVKKQPSTDEVKFEGRSPTTRESPKRSPNVSFHASVSFDTHHKPVTHHRRRRISWNTNKDKPPSFRRSQSSITTTQPPSLHSQILRKQFRTALSMPNGTTDSLNDTTRQSSSLSDNVFLSPSNTNSSSLHSFLHRSQDTRFLAIPSTSSMISTDRMTSNISDASGQSGIESNNLQSSISEQPSSALDDRLNEKLINRRAQQRNSPTSSSTPSTQSLSSSDDDINDVTKKIKGLEIDKGMRSDKRRDIVRQLKWLLEKKPTINARFGLGHRYQFDEKPTQQQKPALNPFVEVIFKRNEKNENHHLFSFSSVHHFDQIMLLMLLHGMNQM
jgi:hypothetical protein